MNKISVFVTGVGGGGHGEQILKALRMAETNYLVIGGDMSPYSKGLFDVDHAYILPPANDESYIEKVIKICKKHDVRVLFHGSEPELKVISSNRDFFEALGIFLPINPSEVIETCLDKVKTCDFLRKYGFHYPRYKKITCENDLYGFDLFPAVLKPSIDSGGSMDAFIAQTQEEYAHFGRYLLSLYREIIVQEYVSTLDSEYTVGVLISMHGKLINSIAVKRNILSSLSNKIRIKNRSQKKHFGEILALSSGISQGEIGPFPEVTRECERIAVALGARGSINIQCRFMDGKVYVFEINPRFSGTTSLRAVVGYNEPDILIRTHVLGEEIEPHFRYKSGVVLRGLCEAFVDPAHLPGEIV